MARIAGIHGVVPPHRYRQDEVTAAFVEWSGVEGEDRDRVERMHAACGVRSRNLVMPLEAYEKIDGFGAANDLFIQHALALGEEAVRGALDRAGVRPEDVDLLMVTSVTGVAAPSLDARLIGPLGLRPDVKRVPIFGLGCVAGAAGIARLHDYLRAWPDHVAVLLSVELCSLTIQRDDASVPNIVASGLFGDGAAAVVAVGDDRPRPTSRQDPGSSQDPGSLPGPRVVATRSRLYPDTERVMGWDIVASGFRIVLAADVADVVRRYLADDVDTFLAGHGFDRRAIESWVCHPGGPKVIDAVVDSLGLDATALDPTRRSLARIGNLSSSSVLHVLADTITEARPSAGTYGLLLAMGPGFCAELVLLRW